MATLFVPTTTAAITTTGRPHSLATIPLAPPQTIPATLSVQQGGDCHPVATTNTANSYMLIRLQMKLAAQAMPQMALSNSEVPPYTLRVVELHGATQ